MRERLEQLLSRFLYEVNDTETRLQIKHQLDDYLQSCVDYGEIYNYSVEDRTRLNGNNLYFQVVYQPHRFTTYQIIDVTLAGTTVKVSNFENNIIGKRTLPKFKL